MSIEAGTNGARFPLSIDGLKRGDFIPAESVERLIGMDRQNPRYRTDLLSLRDQAEAEWRKERGEEVTIITSMDGLRILTHAEQAAHAPRIDTHGMRKLSKAQRKATGVDVSQLGDDQRTKFREWQLRSSWRHQVIRSESRVQWPPPAQEQS